METKKSVFEVLSAIDCNAHTEKKNGLTYLSWAWAWAIVKKHYPNASYAVKEWDGKPYLFDDVLGFLVETSVTIEDEMLTMRLPVMDGANKAQMHVAYTYKTKYGEKTVEPATMFDINTAIMRCLVKNLAMFGLGLYIYAGEDLPENAESTPQEKKEVVIDEKIIKAIAECKTEVELQKIWNENVNFQSDAKFKKVVVDRKKAIQDETK